MIRKRVAYIIASGAAIALTGGIIAGVAAPVAASAASPAQPTCYKTQTGARVCVTIATPTPAPTPTPRIVYRIQKITVKVPVLERQVIVKRVPVVKRVVQRSVRRVAVHAGDTHENPATYPAGGRRLPNGFYELSADGRTYDVGCNPYAFCLFLFPKGARITARAVQDAADWDVPFTTYGPDDRALLAVKVKSTQPYAYPGHKPVMLHTQLVVTTDKSKWPYIIALHTTYGAPSDGTKIAFQDARIADDLASRAVASNVPPWRVQQSQAVAAVATPSPQPTLPPVAKPCSLEGATMYYVRGMGDFAPTNVFDDTLGHTCIAFPKGMQDAPVVLQSSSSDGDEVINAYSWQDGLFVTGTPDVLILQDGSGKGSHRIYVVKDKRTATPPAGTVTGRVGL